MITISEPHFFRRGPVDKSIRAASVLALLLDHVHLISSRATRMLLSGIRDILHLQPSSGHILHETLPRDPRTLSSRFDLEPVTLHFICCPDCHTIYPYEPDDTPHDGNDLKCCDKPSAIPNRGICGGSLWREQAITGVDKRYVPIKKYLHQEFKSWLGRLLSRRGVEDFIDNCPHQKSPGVDELDDVWLSDVILNLKDSGGKKFYPGPGGEGRLIFSLSVDSFDPFGNKTASQSVSSTGIWLVLLNLPWYLRHLPEYMYLAGVIPGPKKPSVDEINSYIQLVVLELLQLWDPGVFFSRTYKYTFGRLIRGMLVPLVCDMLAARQLIGYAGSPRSHYFCILCDLDFDDINVMDRSEWPQKNLEDVRRFSRLWLDVNDPSQRKSVFEAFGWRWSPLFQLPYFDPIKFTVIDSMHALHLGLLQTHCRRLFGIDLDHPGGEALKDESLMVTPRRNFKPLNRKCLKLIEANGRNLLYQLLEYDRPALHTICTHFDIRAHGHSLVVGTRWVLAKNIFAWVS